MFEILILAGVALCALSVIVAAVQLARTQAPRFAAILFVVGLAALIGGAYLAPASFGIDTVTTAWQHLMAGEIDLTL